MVDWSIYSHDLCVQKCIVIPSTLHSAPILLIYLLKRSPLKDETLITLFAETEYIVNSRPVTATSSDVDDPAALTPNHLLLLQPHQSASVRTDVDKDYTAKRWREAHYLANAFWTDGQGITWYHFRCVKSGKGRTCLSRKTMLSCSSTKPSHGGRGLWQR